MAYLLLFFCYFPFIGLNIGTDTQPFALIIAIVLLLKKGKIRIIYRRCFFVSILVLMILSLFSLREVTAFKIVKRLFSYASILLIPLAIINNEEVLDSDKSEKIQKLFILVWFVVGLIQTIINRSFMSPIVPLMRTSATRGVCGLSSEPSFYGYMGFLFFLICKGFRKHKTFFCTISFIQVLLFARSAVGLIYFAVYYLLIMITLLPKVSLKNLIRIALLIGIALGGIYLLLSHYRTSRMGILLYNFLYHRNSLFSDQSVEQRINAIVFSLSRYGLPYYIGTRQIMSGFGGAFYEMGIFSIFLIAPIIDSISNAYDNPEKWVIPLTIFICMMSAIQLSSPTVGFFVGLCMLKKRRLKETPLNVMSFPKSEVQ